MSDATKDPAAEAFELIRIGIGEMKRRMTELIGKSEIGAYDNSRVASLTKDAAAVLGHIRRYEREQREATGRLTPAVVIAYLRELREAPDKLSALLAEAGITVGEIDPWAPADKDEGRSVLS